MRAAATLVLLAAPTVAGPAPPPVRVLPPRPPAAVTDPGPSPGAFASPPVPGEGARGAAVDARRWRGLRRLRLEEGGLHRLRLDPVDLGLLRPDRGDLRLVDEGGRQVPYLFTSTEEEVPVPLGLELDPRLGDRPGRWRSRYRLTIPPDPLGRSRPLPLAALELEVAEERFSRPAQVTFWPPLGTRRPGERPLWNGRLEREEGAGARPLRLPLDRSAHHELFLAVDEGDNEPLRLTGARALVRVGEIAFRAGPGEYRLLLGNRRAAPPRYDLPRGGSSLREPEAFVAEAAPLAPNPAWRRGLGDLVREAPPAVVLWVAILLSVAALVFLTLRALKDR